MFAWKIEIVFKLPEKNQNFLKICLKNRNFSKDLSGKIEIFQKFA